VRAYFDHEKLVVYQRAIQFAGFADEILQGIPKVLAVSDQLDRASTLIALNIAEGNGRFTSADRCRFFDNARGSALESAACLDLLVARRRLDSNVAESGKAVLVEIVSMLVGLIKSNSERRIYEEPLATYGAAPAEQD
jgi:four helix bundle protein